MSREVFSVKKKTIKIYCTLISASAYSRTVCSAEPLRRDSYRVHTTCVTQPQTSKAYQDLKNQVQQLVVLVHSLANELRLLLTPRINDGRSNRSCTIMLD